MSSLFQGFERIEEARERLAGESFMASLYDGRPDFTLLLTPPEPPAEKTAGEAFCKQVEAFLMHEVDPDEIERQAKIPDRVIQGLFKLGAFGMKIPKEYGGLGFSYTNFFIFGGVAQMRKEPPHPRAEFLIAIAGPIVSFLLAGLCIGLVALLELLQIGRAHV